MRRSCGYAPGRRDRSRLRPGLGADGARADHAPYPATRQPDERPGGAERALALDPDLAEPHAVKARHLLRNRPSDEAEAALERALRLDPRVLRGAPNHGGHPIPSAPPAGIRRALREGLRADGSGVRSSGHADELLRRTGRHGGPAAALRRRRWSAPRPRWSPTSVTAQRWLTALRRWRCWASATARTNGSRAPCCSIRTTTRCGTIWSAPSPRISARPTRRSNCWSRISRPRRPVNSHTPPSIPISTD